MKNPNLLGIHLAEKLADHIRTDADFTVAEDAPKETTPEHLIWMLEHLSVKAEKEEWPETKVHRWLGYVMGCLASHRTCTLPCLKGITAEAKQYYFEKEDDELRDHSDPDHPFTLDIGGEG